LHAHVQEALQPFLLSVLKQEPRVLTPPPLAQLLPPPPLVLLPPIVLRPLVTAQDPLVPSVLPALLWLAVLVCRILHSIATCVRKLKWNP